MGLPVDDVQESLRGFVSSKFCHFVVPPIVRLIDYWPSWPKFLLIIFVCLRNLMI